MNDSKHTSYTKVFKIKLHDSDDLNSDTNVCCLICTEYKIIWQRWPQFCMWREHSCSFF